MHFAFYVCEWEGGQNVCSSKRDKKVYYQNTLNANKLDNITSLDENPVEKRNAGTK